RNTINAFTGVNVRWRREGGGEWRAFYVLPVQRRPRGADALADNELEIDRERANARFWSVWAAWPLQDAKVETYVYGLNERDSASSATSNRRLYTPGARLVLAERPGAFDFEIESSWQFGTARDSRSPTDTRDLTVRARFHQINLGYTWDTAWRPRLSLEHSYVSGDRDPEDGRLGRYDTLFGIRRTDFGQTGIHGPLGRSNIQGPSVRLKFNQGRIDGRIHYKAAFLASKTDAWRQAGLRDQTGQSGRTIGNHISGRVRAWLREDRVRLAVGGAILLKGEFARNAPGAPDTGDTGYAYVQLTTKF
ncbi:MAG: alginate export family protein, partial [Pseudomonadota bacterium]